MAICQICRNEGANHRCPICGRIICPQCTISGKCSACSTVQANKNPPITQSAATQQSPPQYSSTVKPKQNQLISGCAVGCLILFLIPVFLVAFGGNYGSGDPSDSEAYVMSHQFVRNSLKAPRTAKFPYSGDEGVSISKSSDNVYAIRGYVDSENSFGAMIRTEYRCVLRYIGDDNWQLEDLQFYD